MPNLTEFLLARIAEDEAVARAAMVTWCADWTTAESPAFGWSNSRHGREPEMPYVVTDDEHGSLLLMGAWREDGQALGAHVANWDPARALAECEAKRQIIDLAFGTAATIDNEWGCCHKASAIRTGWVEPDFEGDTREPLPERCPGPQEAAAFLSVLALPYSDHPDYQSEWGPDAS